VFECGCGTRDTKCGESLAFWVSRAQPMEAFATLRLMSILGQDK